MEKIAGDRESLSQISVLTNFCQTRMKVSSYKVKASNLCAKILCIFVHLPEKLKSRALFLTEIHLAHSDINDFSLLRNKYFQVTFSKVKDIQ